jgi:hypothetical protein
MSGGRKGKWRIAVAALVVVTTLLVMGWLHRRQSREVAAISPPSPPRAAERRIDVLRPDVFSTAASPRAATAELANGTEVCGFGNVPATTADANDINQYVFEKTRKTYDRWKTALLDSSDLRARTIGLTLQRIESRRDDSAAQADVSRDELVQLAAGGNDATVYGIAAGLCQTGFPDADAAGACQRISLTEWARLDPDNAVPWIAIAQAARATGDTRAEASAFARAAAARKFDNFSESLLSFAANEMPQDATPLEKLALTIELIGAEAAWGRPVVEIMRYCSVDSVKQDEPRKECNAVAELLVGPGTTLLNVGLGAKLGERVGWPAERVGQITAEKDALLQLAISNERNPWSCDTVSRTNALMAERAQVGELEALRELRDRREHLRQPVSP